MDHLLDNPTSTDLGTIEVWSILGTLVDFMKREPNERRRTRIMYNIKDLIKGVVYAESPP